MPGSLPGRCEIPVPRESDMRLPQVSDRIKEAPAQALRGVFAGIGQLLLITDKLRNKTPAGQQVPQARAPEPSQTRADPAPPASPAPVAHAAPPASASPADQPAPRPAGYGGPAGPSGSAGPATPATPPAQRVTEARDFDKTGNVRLITSAEAGAGHTAPTADTTATVSEATAATGRRPRRRGPNRARRCRTTASCRSPRCARGCGTSTSRSCGSWPRTRRRTPPGPRS